MDLDGNRLQNSCRCVGACTFVRVNMCVHACICDST